ncbi:putative ABC transport system permease protein [Algoriphagus aquaeductus]|uniref:Putative ABC transport system permease protein n=1 Tax=Algoriphagus aquaeductus TaxID=475299 RepID=A0A326S7A8_9BACT|nr:FtsX-like permease family protein [Algoriphagus aquaeductus]PZV87362.1 putative ABC transport system permease protein [Algoriphagus aquaeductus]
MWKNYFKISLRNLQKRKLYAGINLLGLTLAITSFLAIGLFIHHEWSYDRMYTGSDRIYRINQEFTMGGESQLASTSPSALMPTLLEEFPEVETGTLVFDLSIFSSVMIDAGTGNSEENKFAYVDERFFEVFDFRLLAGQPGRILSEPNQIVLTENTANRYFGSAQNAEGKILKVEGKDYLITGVMENFPSNSHLDFDFLASFKTHRHGREPAWSPSNYYSYVKLKEGADIADFQAKLPAMIEKYLGADMREYGFSFAFFPQPVTAIHLGNQSLNSIKPGTDIQYLYIFAVVALLLVVIGVINYVNLATAEATERHKEVGLRKVMGAERFQLFGQFVAESMVLTAAAVGLSLVGIYLLSEPLTGLVGFKISLDPLLSLPGWMGILLFVILIGLLAGIYPSLILSGMRPIQALGNKVKIGSGAWVRKGLVVIQFFFSIGLLIATLLVKDQLEYMQEVNLGYTKERLISINFHYNLIPKAEAIQQELVRTGSAETIALAANMPVHVKAKYSIFPGGDNDREVMVTGYAGDHHLLKTAGLELISGQDFSETDMMRNQQADTVSGYPILLNETSVKELGWSVEDAVGKKVNFGGGTAWVKGVVKNFYFNSLHHQVGPMVIFLNPDETNVMLIRIPAGDPSAHLASLGEAWKTLVPDRPFNYQFVDQAYAQQYRSEEKVGILFGVFSGLAIFIALMGLFGLVSYVALRRTREIGIRKVLGATQTDVVGVLAADFFKLLFLAALLAIAVSWWFIRSWLQGFAHQTAVEIYPFLTAILLVLLLSVLTIFYRSWKVYTLNPSKTLKND